MGRVDDVAGAALRRAQRAQVLLTVVAAPATASSQPGPPAGSTAPGTNGGLEDSDVEMGAPADEAGGCVRFDIEGSVDVKEHDEVRAGRVAAEDTSRSKKHRVRFATSDAARSVHFDSKASVMEYMATTRSSLVAVMEIQGRNEAEWGILGVVALVFVALAFLTMYAPVLEEHLRTPICLTIVGSGAAVVLGLNHMMHSRTLDEKEMRKELEDSAAGRHL